MTEKQQKFIDWYEAEKLKGLKDIKFDGGLARLINPDAPVGTVDDFIDEFFVAIDAIKEGRFTDISDSL
jgi:hypothetical protein